MSTRVAQSGRFGRGQELAQPMPRLEPGGGQPMRHVRRGDRADHDRLRDTCGGQFVEQARACSGTIAQTMRFAAPVRVHAKCDQMRIAGDRRSQRRRDDVEGMVAPGTREIDDFRLPFFPGSAAQRNRGETARAESAATTSRRESRSVATIISSRNPGWPTLSSSTSA